jgi:hypothetical protein
MLHRGTVEVAGAVFESADHAADGLAEQNLDQTLQQAGLEFEIDKEADTAAAGHCRKGPMIIEITKRPLGIGDVDAPRRVERDARGETLAEHAKPDDQIGDDQAGVPLLDASADAPGQKLGVAFHVGDEREELVRRVGQHALLGMGRHRGNP